MVAVAGAAAILADLAAVALPDLMAVEVEAPVDLGAVVLAQLDVAVSPT